MLILMLILICCMSSSIQAGCGSAEHQVADPDEIKKLKIDIHPPNKKGVTKPQEHNHNIVPNDGKPKKKCCPYDFDSTICKTIGDRVVCGYNKNQGSLDCKEKVKELGGGCRVRKGRVECGYVQPPYINPRRPSASDIQDSNENIIPTNNNQKIATTHSNIKDVEIIDREDTLNGQKSKRLKYTRGPKRCVEVKDRIVCRYDRK